MPFSSRGPSKVLISWPPSYGGSVQYDRTAPAFLALAFRAGFEAFAVQLGAGIAVMLEQRDGVVDPFCTANGRWHSRQWQIAKRDCWRKSFLPHRQLIPGDSLIAAVGHTSSQRPQKIQRPRLNCHASWLVARSISTVRAFDGQAFTQAAQPIHCCGVCSGLPRKFCPPASAPAGRRASRCRS